MTRNQKIGLVVIGLLLISAIIAYFLWRNQTICFEWSDSDSEAFLFYKDKDTDTYDLSKLSYLEGNFRSDKKKNQSDYFILPKNGQIALNSNPKAQIKTIPISMFYHTPKGNGLPFTNEQINIINQYLDQLYMGIQIEFAHTPRNIKTWIPDSSSNVDDTYHFFKDNRMLDVTHNYHLIIADDVVFNTEINNFEGKEYTVLQDTGAAFGFSKRHLIFGSTKIFRSPIMFVHELAHTFDLSDRLKAYKPGQDSTYFFDIMSNKDMQYCTYMVNLPDLFKIHGFDGINNVSSNNILFAKTVDTSRTCFPINDICPCLNTQDQDDLDCCDNIRIRKLLKSKADNQGSSQGYVFSVNGLDPGFGIDLDNLRKNYEQEWMYFIGDENLIPKDEFVEERVQDFLEIRRRNLITILRKKVIANGGTFDNEAYVDPMVLNDMIDVALPIIEGPSTSDPNDDGTDLKNGSDEGTSKDPTKKADLPVKTNPKSTGPIGNTNNPKNPNEKIEIITDFKGKIIDSSDGAAVYGAVVKITSSDLKEPLRTKSDNEGNFMFTKQKSLRNPKIIVSKGGYKIYENHWKGSTTIELIPDN